MDPVRNPYSPGAGAPPVALVGRDAQLESWAVRLRRIESGRGAQPAALYGLRGVGKTVLLAEFAKRARGRDWIVAQIEAGAGRSLREALGEALHGPLADLARPSAGKRILQALKTAVSFKASYDTTGRWNFGIDLSESPGGGADTGRLETDVAKLVRDIGGAAESEGVGLAILIDEAQDLSADELAVVAAAAHQASQQTWPVLIALAGLPSLPRLLAEAKSYTERLFTFDRIEHLDDELSRAALVDTSLYEGVGWDDDAVDFLVRESAGYPYFLQQYGQATWNAAPTSPISLTAAQIGEARGRAALDAGFFRSRWDRATRAEQNYLRAMASDGDGSSLSSAVADRLNRTQRSLGPTRASLIGKGIIYAPEHGSVAFTVPGMADFIARQPAD
jgi:hypothetical protein